MESKEFWQLLLKTANERIPSNFVLKMRKYKDRKEDSETYERRSFSLIAKDGKKYGKGLMFSTEQMKDDNFAEHAGILLSGAMNHCLEKVSREMPTIAPDAVPD